MQSHLLLNLFTNHCIHLFFSCLLFSFCLSYDIEDKSADDCFSIPDRDG